PAASTATPYARAVATSSQCVACGFDLRHPVGAHLRGKSGLGLALPESARPLGACGCPASATAVQAADQLGAPDGPTGASLGAYAAARRGGRPRLRRPGTARCRA